MAEEGTITKWFGENLAELLSQKIKPAYPSFDNKTYCKTIKENVPGLSYKERVTLHAEVLKKLLPENYDKTITILLKTLGEENPKETGMFTEYYWVLPIAKYVELYGLNNFNTSMHALEEITKRSTSEYAIRPYIKKYPKEMLKVMTKWSKSNNFHLRRLASEGLRPKLPWAQKLDIFIENPKPVFNILENLMEDEILFVKKSVANHLTDYLKVNKEQTMLFINKHKDSKNKHTQWIVKRATRKISVL
ncbi:MAG: DNA alkylation repair protein [Candidatus Woesearchaeota archaeon]